ncbi:MAG: sigma factor-like helix-turn-helix DNA-binding protein [bacterium]|nr:sigma factor-like helix-turn-helix DNA-binding protein [bacterium]
MAKISFEKLSQGLVEELTPRVKDVMVGRFGLNAKEPQTLDAVGKQHQITRERVRQIVKEGLAKVREDMSQKKGRERYAAAFEELAAILRGAGSLAREDLLLELLEVKDAANHALFLLTLGDQFYNQRETQDFYSFWTLKKDMVRDANPWHQRLLKFFQKKKSPASERELEKSHGKEALSYLEVSKLIERSPDGEWGLRTWPEVNPRGMRDKAYLVLKQHGSPLHFTEVANLITKLQENLVLQKKKIVLPQTVHNELIKDPRFVLIGRGTYGLADWGLTPGTVKDVMRSILASNGKTMNKTKLIAETLQKRQVKESTIALNLQDQKYFLRNQDGTYTLKL